MTSFTDFTVNYLGVEDDIFRRLERFESKQPVIESYNIHIYLYVTAKKSRLEGFLEIENQKTVEYEDDAKAILLYI